MTRALLIANAQALDLLTLMVVLPMFAGGEYGLGFSIIYPLTGIIGIIAMKAAAVGVATAIVGRMQRLAPLALSLVVLAGLLGATINAIAYEVIR